MRIPLWLAAVVVLPACAATAAPSFEEGGYGETGALSGETDRSFAREGAYAGVSALFGSERFDSDIGGDIIGNQSTTGVGLRLGYRVDPRWAVEGEYRNVDIDTSEVKGGFWDFAVQGKLFFTQGRFQPYGLFGLGMVKGTEGGEDAGFLFRLGAGLDAYITESVAAFVEFSIDGQTFSNSRIPDGTEDDSHLAAQIGVLFRF